MSLDHCPASCLSSVMLLAGLTGSVATGKSTVARVFQDCGAVVVDADILARQVVEPGKPAWRDLLRTFGPDIQRPDRTIDRGRLATLVFRDPAKLRRLNQIVHPRVAREQERLTREVARKDPRAVVLYDAPLLIEAGALKRMDRLVVVTADRATQITRLQSRNQLSRTEAVRRIRAQMPLREKRRLADYIIDGTLPPTQLRRVVRQIYDELRRLA